MLLMPKRGGSDEIPGNLPSLQLAAQQACAILNIIILFCFWFGLGDGWLKVHIFRSTRVELAV